MNWIILFCFKPYLDKYDYKVVRVKGWGCFLVDCPRKGRITVKYEWYKGLI